MNGPFHPRIVSVPTAKGSALRHLSDILGTDQDRSLRLIGVRVDDDVVCIEVVGVQGHRVERYHADEALSVVTELLDWARDQTPDDDVERAARHPSPSDGTGGVMDGDRGLLADAHPATRGGGPPIAPEVWPR